MADTTVVLAIPPHTSGRDETQRSAESFLKKTAPQAISQKIRAVFYFSWQGAVVSRTF